VSDMMLVAGNAIPELASSISKILNIPLAQATVNRFSDGECAVEIHQNVRGRDVFIIQSTCPPVNDNLMELAIIADALGRASAGRITAVVPYYGYARQDRRTRSSRVPITARLVADILAIGIDPVVVSPDIGGVVRARAMAKKLGCDLAIIEKRRPHPNEAQVMRVIGDVAGRHCIMVDDIIDTAGTLCKAANALVERGASKVSAYVIHPVLSGGAIQNIESSVIDEIVVTDSVPLSPEAKNCQKIRQLSLANMLAETIRRIHSEESISSMFRDDETS
jgi:ribose-phosphate pyrophosphokinase